MHNWLSWDCLGTKNVCACCEALISKQVRAFSGQLQGLGIGRSVSSFVLNVFVVSLEIITLGMQFKNVHPCSVDVLDSRHAKHCPF